MDRYKDVIRNAWEEREDYMLEVLADANLEWYDQFTM